MLVGLVCVVALVYLFDRATPAPAPVANADGEQLPAVESLLDSSPAKPENDAAETKLAKPPEPVKEPQKTSNVAATEDPEKNDDVDKIKEPETPKKPVKKFHIATPEFTVKTLLTKKDLNKFANPVGKDFGLARPNEFSGMRLMAWSNADDAEKYLLPRNNPLWAALREKGFEVVIRKGRFDPQWLAGIDQLWIFSGKTRGMNEAGYEAVERFVRSGRGLYLVAENHPYLVDANALARRIFQTRISGDYHGNNLIAVRGQGVTHQDYIKVKDNTNVKSGKQNIAERLKMIRKATHYAEPHSLLTDVNFIFEGVTISHIDPTERLQTVLVASDQKILAAVATGSHERVVVDCGFTRYYCVPPHDLINKTAATIRYAENIAAFLMGKEDKTTHFSELKEARNKTIAANDALAFKHAAEAAQRRQKLAAEQRKRAADAAEKKRIEAKLKEIESHRKTAASKLRTAKRLLQSKRTKSAQKYLKEIVTKYADTPSAAEAKRLLK